MDAMILMHPLQLAATFDFVTFHPRSSPFLQLGCFSSLFSIILIVF